MAPGLAPDGGGPAAPSAPNPACLEAAGLLGDSAPGCCALGGTHGLPGGVWRRNSDASTLPSCSATGTSSKLLLKTVLATPWGSSELLLLLQTLASCRCRARCAPSWRMECYYKQVGGLKSACMQGCCLCTDTGHSVPGHTAAPPRRRRRNGLRLGSPRRLVVGRRAISASLMRRMRGSSGRRPAGV